MPGQSSTGGSLRSSGGASSSPPKRLTWSLSRSLAAADAMRTICSAAR